MTYTGGGPGGRAEATYSTSGRIGSGLPGGRWVGGCGCLVVVIIGIAVVMSALVLLIGLVSLH